MKRLSALVLGASLALSIVTPAAAWGGRGSEHSHRCRGQAEPPMLGIIGGPWTCTKDGWRWPVPGHPRWS